VKRGLSGSDGRWLLLMCCCQLFIMLVFINYSAILPILRQTLIKGMFVSFVVNRFFKVYLDTPRNRRARKAPPKSARLIITTVALVGRFVTNDTKMPATTEQLP
jgi:hypothetical protein